MADDLEVVWGSLKGQLGKRFGQDPVHLDEVELIVVFKDGEGFGIYGYMHYFFGRADIRHLHDLIGKMRTMADSYHGPCGIHLLCNASFSTLAPSELSGLPRHVSYQRVRCIGGDGTVEIEDVDLGEAASEFLRRLKGSDDSRYMVLMAGKVAQVHVHYMEADQRDRIEALGDEPDVARIQEILNVDDLSTTQGDSLFTGIGTSRGDCRISVFDRDGALVWESGDGFDLDTGGGDGEIGFPFRTEDVMLYREDFQGLYKVYMLDMQGEFDPVKLGYKPVNVCGRYHLIGDLVYGEGELHHLEDPVRQVNYWNTVAI